jgi:hypothetical protein
MASTDLIDDNDGVIDHTLRVQSGIPHLAPLWRWSTGAKANHYDTAGVCPHLSFFDIIFCQDFICFVIGNPTILLR